MSRERIPTTIQYLTYTTDGSIPTFDNCLEIPSDCKELSVNGAVQIGAATNIKHQIVGYLRGLLRPEIIATYEKLEEITTIGKYDNCMENIGIRFSHIGVATQATGVPAATEIAINYK